MGVVHFYQYDFEEIRVELDILDVLGRIRMKKCQAFQQFLESYNINWLT